MQHLSTRTLRPSHTESFVDKWTFLVEDSLVSPSHKLGLEKLLKTQDISSLTSQKESESASQELFSSKMSKELSQQKPQTENQFSDMSSEHWKAWVTEQRREYSQRVKSASLIRENESTFVGYPTPSVAGCVEGGVAKNVQMDEKGIFYRYNKKGVKWSVKLRDAVIHQASKQWLTPTGVDIERTPEGMEKRKKYRESIGRKYVEGCLTEQVKNWATPNTMDHLEAGISGSYKESLEGRRARSSNLRDQVDPTCVKAYKDAKTWGTPKEQDSRAAMTDRGKHNLGEQVHGMHNNQDTQQDQTNLNTSGKPQGSLKLNPDWVEQLMGLPIGWTDFDSSEME